MPTKLGWVLLVATGLAAQPVITANGIANATGYQTTLAPGCVFVIFGSAMGPATISIAQAPNYPSTLSGTSVTFTPAGGGLGVTGPLYSFVPAAGTYAPGTYTVTANGGTQVGPFTVSADFPTSFSAPNFDAQTMIDRTKPLTLTWSGSGIDRTIIFLASTFMTGDNVHVVEVTCVVPAALGTYTVPVAALAYLDAVPASMLLNTGTLSITGRSLPGSFTASILPGGHTDFGNFNADRNFQKFIPIQ